MPTHIQIGDITPRIQFDGDGVQTRFDFPFPIFNETDLEVYLDDALQSSGFSVFDVGGSNGGYIIFEVAPAVGETATLRRWLGISRTSDFQESGELRASVLNDELDYQIAALQQVASEATRTLRLSPTDVAAGLELPVSSLRAGNYLAFDDAGTLVAAPAPVGGAIVSSFAATLLDDPDATSAQATLGLSIGADVLAPGGDGSGLTGISGLPTGTIIDFAGASSPSGTWLDCDGANVSRTTYADLFSAIGVVWGVGDGSTTFAVPDLRRKATIGEGGTATATLGNAVGDIGGAETHTLTTAQLATHTHNNQKREGGGTPTGYGAASMSSTVPMPWTSTSSTGSNSAHNNMQPSAVVRKLIKAA